MAILETAFVEFLFNLAACIVILGFGRKRNREDAAVGMGLLAVYVISTRLGMIGSQPLAGQSSPTMDGFLYRADQALGLGSLELCRWVLSTPALHLLLAIVYLALPIAFAIIWSLERSRVLVAAEVLATVAGFACYHLVPATGPIFAFRGFPFVAPHASGWVLLDASFARNGFPSLHFGWALLLLWNSHRRSAVCFASIFLFAITLATVGLGEHYFVDLVAAVPFCGAVQFLASRKWHGLPFHIGKLPQIREARTA
jgi:hypothetical protein